jgi:hypothetical protein
VVEGVTLTMPMSAVAVAENASAAAAARLSERRIIVRIRYACAGR